MLIHVNRCSSTFTIILCISIATFDINRYCTSGFYSLLSCLLSFSVQSQPLSVFSYQVALRRTHVPLFKDIFRHILTIAIIQMKYFKGDAALVFSAHIAISLSEFL